MIRCKQPLNFLTTICYCKISCTKKERALEMQYEYKIVRVKLGLFATRYTFMKDLQSEIDLHAKDNWELVQVYLNIFHYLILKRKIS